MNKSHKLHVWYNAKTNFMFAVNDDLLHEFLLNVANVNDFYWSTYLGEL